MANHNYQESCIMKKLLTAFAAIIAAAQIQAEPAPGGVVKYSYPERDIFSIQDQSMVMSGKMFRSVQPGEKFRPGTSYEASLNVFLIADGKSGKNYLIDAGYGKPQNQLLPQLEKMNLKPTDIDAVFITHIHPDHVGGLTTADGKPAFPQAKIYIARREYEEWLKDPKRKNLAKHLTPNQKNLVLADYDEEVKPYGLTPLCYPGHTPGHTVFRMELAQEGKPDRKIIYFVGDIVHAAALQIPRPQFCAGFDMSAYDAAQSRLKLLREADHWYGAHIMFPGIVRIERQKTKSGFKFNFELEK